MLVIMNIGSAISRKGASYVMILLIIFSGHLVSAQESCDCPAVWDCTACTSGITSLSLKYNASGNAAVAIKIDDQVATIFDRSVDPGDTITINGSLASGKFAGNKLSIQEDGIFTIAIILSCDNLFVKSAFGNFIVVSGASKNGGTLCCDPATLERVPPVFSECPADITGHAGTSGVVPVYWRVPLASDVCGEPRVVSTHSPGDVFPLGSTNVVYTATDRSGNISTCSFQVNVTEEIDLEPTTIITPDGDGINDKWLLPDIEKYPDNQVTVVDRWGSVIFARTGYNNESVVWDGRNTSGAIVPTGTYFYAITVRAAGSTVDKRGFVELIRAR